MIHAELPKKHKCLPMCFLGIVESTTLVKMTTVMHHIVTWLVKIWTKLVVNRNEKKEETKNVMLLLFMCAMKIQFFERSCDSVTRLSDCFNNYTVELAIPNSLIIFPNLMEVDTCLPCTYSLTISRITFCSTTYNFWQDDCWCIYLYLVNHHKH